MTEAKELINLFNAAKSYINQGISVVPIDDNTGKRLIAYSKNPDFCKNKDEIFKSMSNATGDLKLAIITGEMSKNLECIDIDEKYRAGISAEYLKTIQDFYPEIFAKLRIEKTRNNGLHIYYTQDVKSQSIGKDIAKRPATASELENDPKRKTYTFIEVKNNNSSFTCYPSNGYTLIQDKPIPQLTQNERDTLINIGKSFNQVFEKIVEIKVSNKSLRNYSTNPFEDYNSDNAAFFDLLKRHEWTIVSNSKNEVRFARPTQDKWVSACFYRDKQLFVVFTSSATLKAGNYKPSTVLSELDFNRDNKECFAWLVENGYGKLYKRFEYKLVTNAIVNNKSLPANVSEKAKKEFESKKNDFDSKYPHGIFWEQTEEKGEITFRINRELILRVAESLNFKLYRGELVYLDEKIIRNSTASEFFANLKRYVKEDEAVNISIYDKFENYVQQAGRFLISRLPEIAESEILHDTHNTCFKAFSNVVLKITKSGVEKIEWDKIQKFVLEEKVIDFNFKQSPEEGLFIEFLQKAILDHTTLRPKIGWMAHDYNDSINPYFLLLIETVRNPKHGGGSGKDLFASLVGFSTTMHAKDGGSAKIDQTLLQSWSGQRMMLLSDIGNKFPFAKIKSIVSNNATVKKLYKNEISISVQHLPKIVCTSNYSFEIEDGGVDRRLRYIEFSDFFTKQGGVGAYFGGKRFPRKGMEDDWTNEDWLGYFNYMVNSIVEYFKSPILQNTTLTESGWFKQFAINHGQNTLDFIVENIDNFIKQHIISQNDFQSIYDQYCTCNGIDKRYKKSAQGLNDALEDYCYHFGIAFDKRGTSSLNGSKFSCKKFGDGINTTPEAEDIIDLPF